MSSGLNPGIATSPWFRSNRHTYPNKVWQFKQRLSLYRARRSNTWFDSLPYKARVTLMHQIWRDASVTFSYLEIQVVYASLPFRSKTQERGKAAWGASVLVRFWTLSRSWRASCCIRSIPSNQWTRCASRPSGPKENLGSSPEPTFVPSYRPGPQDLRSFTTNALLERSRPARQGPQLLKRRPSAKTVASTLVTV